MASSGSLGDFEQILLLTILRLRENAYGVAIRSEIWERTGREVAPGALYTALDRLERKGLLASQIGEPTPERGGRSKRFYSLTAEGKQAIAQAQYAFQRLLEGLDIFGLADA